MAVAQRLIAIASAADVSSSIVFYTQRVDGSDPKFWPDQGDEQTAPDMGFETISGVAALCSGRPLLCRTAPEGGLFTG